jgi:hypothetical protein
VLWRAQARRRRGRNEEWNIDIGDSVFVLEYMMMMGVYRWRLFVGMA